MFAASEIAAHSAQLFDATQLSSENIANRAFIVADATRSSGYCYAAVCRALKPLGVELTGASAYMAQPLLLNDSRFLPLTINSVEQLRRGDIIVYTRSTAHPHGHISVYEGNYEEASDHIAPVTHTKAYGGATVFRLRDEPFPADPIIAIAPDFRAMSKYPSMENLPSEVQQAAFFQKAGSQRSTIWGELKREYKAIAKQPLLRPGSLGRRLLKFISR